MRKKADLMVMYLNSSLMVVIGLLLPVIASHAEEDEGEKLPEMGLYFDRSAGNKVNLRIVEKKFRLYFVDNENKILPPEYDSALVHAENVIRKEREGRFILRLSSDGQYLTSPRVVLPPIDYWIRVTLRNAADVARKEALPRARLRQ